MEQPTSLTSFEYKLVQNADMMHAKNSVIKKVSGLFASVSNEYVEAARVNLPADLIATPPKISRGEQYLGLPYVMLDYPRNFSKTNTLAIRTFFWWGHFFSIHLQLSGAHQQQHAQAIMHAIEEGHFEGWFAGVHSNEWHHHFDEDNYQPVSKGLSLNPAQTPFIKLAKKIPLTEWDHVQFFLTDNFKMLLHVLTL